MRDAGWSLAGALSLVLVCTYSSSAVGGEVDTRSLGEAVEAARNRGGLVIYVGGDPSRLAGLPPSSRSLVQMLAADDRAVETARQRLHSRRLYGQVSIEPWDRDDLPYIDNLANVIVAYAEMGVPPRELERVLCPGGVAFVHHGDRWEMIRKPWPGNIDQWTHFMHDASGNAVARDRVVGPPRRMQWTAAPLWSRNHHKLASMSSTVSAQGRIFAIVDEATAGSMLVPGRWSVLARDAFNGVLLWKRAMSSWAWENHRFRSGPVQLPRLLVTTGECLYVPLGMSEPVSALDAATGHVEATYEPTRGAEEIVVTDDVLLAVTGSPAVEQAAIAPDVHRAGPFTSTKAIVAIDLADGERLWRWQEDGSAPLMPLTLAADDGRVLFQVGDEIVCVGLSDGELLWQTASSPSTSGSGRSAKSKGRRRGRGPFNQWKRQVGWSTATLVVTDRVVLWADRSRVKALSVRDGHLLWQCECSAGFKSSTDVLVAGGRVWIGPDYTVGRDLDSGQVQRRLLGLDDLRTVGHHHRCYREKATERYLIGGYRGMEFFDLAGQDHSRNNWTRGTCQYGILPCNGLVYAPPHACGCYMEAKLCGFWALAPEMNSAVEAKPQPRRHKGPAYGDLPSGAGRGPYSAEAWPTYRHDVLRSGAAPSALPANLASRWQAKVGDRISAPVIAEDKVVVSAIDRHRVFALGTDDGATRWTFTAGGRIDSPPTLYAGRVLFGSADGYVYCLRLRDGRLVWRFRAAAQDRRTVARDRVESLWPVHGSVLVLDGVAYVTAGRSSYLDGGIDLYGLDPATGKVLHHRHVASVHPRADEGRTGPAEMTEKLTQNQTDPKTFQAPDRSDAFSMAGGTTTDVLVSDGTSIFMRTLRFDKTLTPQQARARHLFSTSSLLDGHEHHRSHWLLGIGDFSRMPVAYSWIANRPGNHGNHVAVPYGLLLAFDADRVWGVRRLKGYTLYADRFEPLTGRDKQRPDIRALSSEEIPQWTWSSTVEIRPRALVRAGDTLLLGGMPALAEGHQGPQACAEFEGRGKGLLWVVAADSGDRLQSLTLPAPPVWDGMAVANQRLYVCRVDGAVECWGARAGRADR